MVSASAKAPAFCAALTSFGVSPKCTRLANVPTGAPVASAHRRSAMATSSARSTWSDPNPPSPGAVKRWRMPSRRIFVHAMGSRFPVTRATTQSSRAASVSRRVWTPGRISSPSAASVSLAAANSTIDAHTAGILDQMASSSTPWKRRTSAATSWSVEPWCLMTSMWVSMPWCSRMACANAFLWNLFASVPTARMRVPSTSNVRSVLSLREEDDMANDATGRDAEANLGESETGVGRATVPSARAAGMRVVTSRGRSEWSTALTWCVDGFRSSPEPQANSQTEM